MNELRRRAVELSDDEYLIVDAYRRVRERNFGDLEVSVSHGKLVKVFEVVKNSIMTHTLKEVVVQK